MMYKSVCGVRDECHSFYLDNDVKEWGVRATISGLPAETISGVGRFQQLLHPFLLLHRHFAAFSIFSTPIRTIPTLSLRITPPRSSPSPFKL